MGYALTQVYLEPAQKRKLEATAKQRGMKPAEAYRAAIEAFNEGVTPDELKMLDAMTIKARADINEMIARLDQSNAFVDKVFAEVAKMRAKAGLPK
jgi:hypothetical protein